MAQSEVRSKRESKQPKPAYGVELKPIDYQPPKAEPEAGTRLPAPFDRVVDALFAGDRPHSDTTNFQN